MNYLYLDIETIPAQSSDAHALIADTVKPPAQMKKAETIALWEANEKPQAIKDAIAKTSFDGAAGHICCIGFAVNDGAPDCCYLADRYTPSLEAEVLRGFFEKAGEIGANNPFPVCIVGHNVVSFDIRFIWQRAIILGVPVPAWFPRDPKPWGSDTFDTMTAFAGQRNTISLDKLARAMGLAGKGDVDGSMVADMWKDGKIKEIAEYCKDDVELTRKIHRKMMVAYGEQTE